MWKLTLLQLELLHTSLIGGDGGALDTDAILLDGLGGLNGDLVIGLVTVLKTLLGNWSSARVPSSYRPGPAYQVVILQVNVEVPNWAMLAEGDGVKIDAATLHLRQNQLEKRAVSLKSR